MPKGKYIRTPEIKQAASIREKKRQSLPEVKKQKSEITKKQWANPESRKRIFDSTHTEECLKKREISFHREEYLKNLSERTKRFWDNPIFYKMMIEIHNSPETVEKHRIASIKNWENPNYCLMMEEIFSSMEFLEKMKSLSNDPKYVENKSKKMKEFFQTNEGKEAIEKQRQKMKNGLAAYANSFITNPSKPQVELYEMVKSLYPSAEIGYPIYEFNKNVDICIPEHLLVIEYDGSWWHQDEESDKKRQEQIESLGYNFLRYRDHLPTLPELKKRIEERIYDLF